MSVPPVCPNCGREVGKYWFKYVEALIVLKKKPHRNPETAAAASLGVHGCCATVLTQHHHLIGIQISRDIYNRSSTHGSMVVVDGGADDVEETVEDLE